MHLGVLEYPEQLRVCVNGGLCMKLKRMMLLGVVLSVFMALSQHHVQLQAPCPDPVLLAGQQHAQGELDSGPGPVCPARSKAMWRVEVRSCRGGGIGLD